MIPGIPWIPRLKMFIFIFYFKAEFVKQSKYSELPSHLRKHRLLTVSFYCFQLGNVFIQIKPCGAQTHPSLDIPACTPAYFIFNISNLTLDVIGSCKTQFIPPLIMLQLGKLAPFITDHFWILNQCTPVLQAFYNTWSVLQTSFLLNDLMVDIF